MPTYQLSALFPNRAHPRKKRTAPLSAPIITDHRNHMGFFAPRIPMRERPSDDRNISGRNHLSRKESSTSCRAATGLHNPQARIALRTRHKTTWTIHACRKTFFHKGRNKGAVSMRATFQMG